MLDDAWLGAIADYSTAQAAIGIARTTLYTRRQHMQHLARRLDVGPWEVTADALLAFMASHEWAPETRRGRQSSYVSFYGWASSSGRVPADPTAGMVKARPGKPNPRPVPDVVYLEALIRADEDEALWIDLAAEHGLRRGEIAVIRAEHIVPTLLGYDLVVQGKGRKLRDVPLTASMARALLDRADRLGGGYLFPGEDEGHVSPRWLGTRINRLLSGAYTIHKLRHRAATRFWIAADGDPYVVADLMGWASLNMVRTYVKLPDERKRAIIERASRERISA